MFRLLDFFVALLVLAILLKFAMPKEIGDLVTQIALKILILIRNGLNQVS